MFVEPVDISPVQRPVQPCSAASDVEAEGSSLTPRTATAQLTGPAIEVASLQSDGCTARPGRCQHSTRAKSSTGALAEQGAQPASRETGSVRILPR